MLKKIICAIFSIEKKLDPSNFNIVEYMEFIPTSWPIYTVGCRASTSTGPLSLLRGN